MSDHRHIRFRLEGLTHRTETFRNPKQTNWVLYRELLSTELGVEVGNLCTTDEVELAAQQTTHALLQSYEESCPLRCVTSNRDAPWWNPELSRIRAETRKLFNRAKRLGTWETYKRSLNAYNKALKQAKRNSWRGFCESLTALPAVARMQKILKKDPANMLGLLKKAAGGTTGSAEETLEELRLTHFIGSTICPPEAELPEGNVANPFSRRVYNSSGKIFTSNRVSWAVNSFKPFKSPGNDSIFPALLQRGPEILLTYLTKIFRSSFTLGYIPKGWRNARVIYIPKGGKRDSSLARSYRPISLTSFFLKIMEKVVNLHIRDVYLVNSPLYKYQFAYQKGKSTSSALHKLVQTLEKAKEEGEIALGCFLDIEGAFDNTSYISIIKAVTQKGVDTPTISWIRAMLDNRTIRTELNTQGLTFRPSRGCPQGGVLSPLLWLMVVDSLLVKLSNSGYDVQGYADDLVIIIRGKFDQTLSDLLQSALRIVEKWCGDEGLGVNPSKTSIVPFTRRRKFHIQPPLLAGKQVDISNEVTYLGVVLDQRLTWNAHLKRTLEKATKATWCCQRLFGRNWGLSPKMTLWSYMTIIRPMVTYACYVWWPKVKEAKAKLQLQKLQRLTCLGSTGAFRTCPSAALEVILSLPPLHLYIKREAAMEEVRLRRLGLYKYIGTGHGDASGQTGALDMVNMVSDLVNIMDFEKPFQVQIVERQAWENSGFLNRQGALLWYTDGSRLEGSAGLGIKGPHCEISKSLGSWATVFQAEVHAIEMCAREILKRNPKGATIYILSDSQAALKALNAYEVTSRLVWDCLVPLKDLGSRNKLSLVWVPGHEGIPGNEAADKLAKAGASLPFVGPEPFCGLNYSHIRSVLDAWLSKEHLKYWRSLPALRQSKKLIAFTKQGIKAILALSKQDLRILTGLLTGHAPVKYHLRKMGLVQEDSCRYCREEIETTEHILCSCEALAQKRLMSLGGAILNPAEIRALTPRKIVSFGRRLAIFSGELI